MKHVYDKDEGDDYVINITDLGKAFLGLKERERELKNDESENNRSF
jgi:hypothetical protein